MGQVNSSLLMDYVVLSIPVTITTIYPIADEELHGDYQPCLNP